MTIGICDHKIALYLMVENEYFCFLMNLFLYWKTSFLWDIAFACFEIMLRNLSLLSSTAIILKMPWSESIQNLVEQECVCYNLKWRLGKMKPSCIP